MRPSVDGYGGLTGSRIRWLVVAAAVAALVLIAVVGVAGFVGLGLLQGTRTQPDSGMVSPEIAAPVPTTIRPELFAPPNDWLNGAG